MHLWIWNNLLFVVAIDGCNYVITLIQSNAMISLELVISAIYLCFLLILRIDWVFLLVRNLWFLSSIWTNWYSQRPTDASTLNPGFGRTILAFENLVVDGRQEILWYIWRLVYCCYSWVEIGRDHTFW